MVALVIAAPILVWATWKYVTGIDINWVAVADVDGVLIVNLVIVSALARARGSCAVTRSSKPTSGTCPTVTCAVLAVPWP